MPRGPNERSCHNVLMLHYVSDITSEEACFGFDVHERPSGIVVVTRALLGGLQAVKILDTDGAIRYAICDPNMIPLYRHAESLDELGERFYCPPLGQQRLIG